MRCTDDVHILFVASGFYFKPLLRPLRHDCSKIDFHNLIGEDDLIPIGEGPILHVFTTSEISDWEGIRYPVHEIGC
jgi:hypothetical protein